MTWFRFIFCWNHSFVFHVHGTLTICVLSVCFSACVRVYVRVFPAARPLAVVTVCKWEKLPNRDVKRERREGVNIAWHYNSGIRREILLLMRWHVASFLHRHYISLLVFCLWNLFAWPVITKHIFLIVQNAFPYWLALRSLDGCRYWILINAHAQYYDWLFFRFTIWPQFIYKYL